MKCNALLSAVSKFSLTEGLFYHHRLFKGPSEDLNGTLSSENIATQKENIYIVE